MLNFHTFGKKHLAKIVIPGGLKTTFLQKLHQKGISALSMFLAPDGLGQMVEEVMRLCLDNKAPANPDDVFLRRVYT